MKLVEFYEDRDATMIEMFLPYSKRPSQVR